MADLTSLTSYAEVRAIIGVNDLEIADTQLSLPIYYAGLVAELDDLDKGIRPAFTALPPVETDLSDDQLTFKSAVKLFSTVCVARTVLPSLVFAAPQTITDSKASMTRFDIDKTNLEAKLDAQWGLARKRLTDAYNSLSSNTPTSVVGIFFASGAGTNPVTGV